MKQQFTRGVCEFDEKLGDRGDGRTACSLFQQSSGENGRGLTAAAEADERRAVLVDTR